MPTDFSYQARIDLAFPANEDLAKSPMAERTIDIWGWSDVDSHLICYETSKGERGTYSENLWVR